MSFLVKKASATAAMAMAYIVDENEDHAVLADREIFQRVMKVSVLQIPELLNLTVGYVVF